MSLSLILLASCGALSGGSCSNWSEWKYESTTCESNFWCIFKNQKATYKNYYKQRECKNGMQRKTKREKVKCGC